MSARSLAIVLVLANVACYAWRTVVQYADRQALPRDLQPLPEGTPTLQLLSEGRVSAVLPERDQPAPP